MATHLDKDSFIPPEKTMINSDHLRLAEKIRDIYSEGFVLDGDVLEYVDSTLSAPSATKLESVLTDDSHCEHGSLVDLVFYPDESVQIRLEDLLGSDDREYARFGKKDEAEVVDLLHLKPPVVGVRFPDDRGEFVMEVPDYASAGFLSRLNVANKPDGRLVSAIRNHISENHRTILAVRLRNARFPKSERNIRFLEKFFRGAEKKTADMFACLDFAIRFLGETGDDQDLRTGLLIRKQRILENLNRARRLEAKTGNINIETMILQGMRIPYADKTEMMNQAAMADEIGFMVFGAAFS